MMPELAMASFKEFMTKFRQNSQFAGADPAECLKVFNRIAISTDVAAFLSLLVDRMQDMSTTECTQELISDLIFQAIYNPFDYMKSDIRTPSAIAAHLDELSLTLSKCIGAIEDVITPRLYSGIPKIENGDRYITPEIAFILSDAAAISIYDSNDYESARKIGSFTASINIYSLMCAHQAFIKSIDRESLRLKKLNKKGKGTMEHAYAVFELNNIFIKHGATSDNISFNGIRNGLIMNLINTGFGFTANNSIGLERVRDLIYKSFRRS